MDGVGVQSDILNVEPGRTKVLTTQHALARGTHHNHHTQSHRHPKHYQQRLANLFGGPLKPSHHGVLDFVQVLHTLGSIDQHVGPTAFGTEAPDLPGLGDVPLVRVGKIAGPCLEILLVGHFSLCAKTTRIYIRCKGWGEALKPCQYRHTALRL